MNLTLKKTYLGLVTLFCLVLAFSASAFAVPTLQLGAPGGPGEGDYADYFDQLNNPDENDSAVTSGTILYAAGAYQNDELLIGGQYNDSTNNWSQYGFNSVFDTARAVIMATVPNGTLGSGYLTIEVDGAASISAFYSTGDYEVGFDVPNPPSNHAPIQDQDYMFFNIGDFGKTDSIPNFDEYDESGETGSASGEIKELLIATGGYEWIHFDLFALVTDTQGGVKNTKIVTTAEGNPGSKDLTWKDPEWNTPPTIPEPGTLLLLGSGLVGLVLSRKKIAG